MPWPSRVKPTPVDGDDVAADSHDDGGDGLTSLRILPTRPVWSLPLSYVSFSLSLPLSLCPWASVTLPLPLSLANAIDIAPDVLVSQGLLLGGGRVLHKLKEEFGGVLEYRRPPQGVVCIYGQRGSPTKAASCVRTALLLRDKRGESRVRENMVECVQTHGVWGVRWLMLMLMTPLASFLRFQPWF